MSPTLTLPARAVSSVGAFRRLTITELKLFVRDRVGLIWGVAFPMVMLIIFGSIPSFRQPANELGGLTYLDVYIPILVALSLAFIALNWLPTVLAGYRERGILRRLAVTPIGPARVLAAQLAVSLGFMVITLIAILTVARLVYGVPLPQQVVGFVVAVAFAASALFAIGLFVSAVATTGRAAGVIGTLLYFPMLFFAGLWLPQAVMPVRLRDVSHYTPLGAAVQSLQAAAFGHGPSLLGLAVMAAYAVVFGLTATRLFRWQ